MLWYVGNLVSLDHNRSYFQTNANNNNNNVTQSRPDHQISSLETCRTFLRGMSHCYNIPEKMKINYYGIYRLLLLFTELSLVQSYTYRACSEARAHFLLTTRRQGINTKVTVASIVIFILICKTE